MTSLFDIEGSSNLFDKEGSSLDCSPYEQFYNNFSSNETRESYFRRIKLFLEFLLHNRILSKEERKEKNKKLQSKEQKRKEFEINCNRFYEKARKDPRWLNNVILKYLDELKKRYELGNNSPNFIDAGTIRNRKNAIKSFIKPLTLNPDNKININWDVVKLPQEKRFTGGTAYTLEQIRKISEYPDERMKALVYIFATGGIRLGTFDGLKVKDVHPIYRDGKHVCSYIKSYGETNDEYPALITIETVNEINKFLDLRRSAGENITEESPLFIKRWNIETGITNPEPLTSTGIKKLIESALYAQGLRTKLDLENSGIRRHKVQMDHGFRKFHYTVLFGKDIEPEQREILTGHANKGMVDHYYRPNSSNPDLIIDGKLTDIYLSFEDEFTIDPKNKKINVLEGEIEEKLTKKYNKRLDDFKQEFENKLLIQRFNITIARIKKEFEEKFKNDLILEPLRDRKYLEDKYNKYLRLTELSPDEQFNFFLKSDESNQLDKNEVEIIQKYTESEKCKPLKMEFVSTFDEFTDEKKSKQWIDDLVLNLRNLRVEKSKEK